MRIDLRGGHDRGVPGLRRGLENELAGPRESHFFARDSFDGLPVEPSPLVDQIAHAYCEMLSKA